MLLRIRYSQAFQRQYAPDGKVTNKQTLIIDALK
jgi:hypothetical protein